MAKIKNPTVVIAGGEQPILFAPQVSQSLNTVQWQNNPSNGGFPVSLIATLDGTIVTSQNNTYTVQESDHGKTFSVVASAASFVSSFSNITLGYFYIITKNITNGTASGAQSIKKNGTATVMISPITGYLKPYNNGDITVTGADYTYNRNTGIISLSNPTGAVTISANCPLATIPTNYLTFSSVNPFTLQLTSTENIKVWNGILYSSADKNAWNVTSLSDIVTAGEDNGKYYVYLCGRNNTVISNPDSYGRYNMTTISLSGNDIDCEGNIESLLDWVEVDTGIHPTIVGTFSRLFYNCTGLRKANIQLLPTIKYYLYSIMFSGCTSLTTIPELPATTVAQGCYTGMFYGCTSLTMTPELPATTLAPECYNNMFYGCTSLTAVSSLPAMTLARECYGSMFSGCTSLTTIPELPATTLVESCYRYMFMGCTNIKISATQVGEYVNEYRIPTNGTGIDANYAKIGMFNNTGGTFTGTPAVNTTYYTSNTVIPAT